MKMDNRALDAQIRMVLGYMSRTQYAFVERKRKEWKKEEKRGRKQRKAQGR